MHHLLRVLAMLFVLSSGSIRAVPGDPSPGASWLAEAERELAEREYHASTNDSGLQAPNRAQGFRTYFDSDGIRLVARSADVEPLVSLALTAVGRSGLNSWLGGAEVTPLAAQVVLHWLGIEIRYGNSPAGLHQVITIEQSPGGSGPLELVLDIAGATPLIHGNSVVLENAANPIELGGIQARDASGQLLPVTVSQQAGSLEVSIDDQSAAYPITVQSVLTGTTDGLVESNQENAQLGTSVAGAGDVNRDGYGDVIVGAYLFDAGEEDEGAAFLYFGGPGAFNITPDAQLESNQPDAGMGYSVAGLGDVNGDQFDDLVVGAYLYTNGHNDEGAAFLYFGGAGAFDLTADAQLESNQAGAHLGTSVGGAGDVNGDGFADIIAGAMNYANGQPQEGSAFIYFGGAGSFNTTADALLESNQVDAFLGVSVAGAGDVNGDGYADVMAGASHYDNGESDEGAAFIYFGGAGAFNTTSDARLEMDQADAEMGWSVAGTGDVNGDGFDDVIVGALFYTNGESGEGAAFVYFGGAGAFDLAADAQLEANQPDARMGASVAGAGDVNVDGFADVIVGAYGYDNGETDEGVAFVYFGGAGLFNSASDATLELNQGGAFAGYAVAGAGDVNGDGFGDVVIGAFLYDNGQDAEGAASLYFGGPKTLETNPHAQLESDQVNAQMGIGVAGAGDVNGDGFGDFVVGAQFFDNGHGNEGAAFVYFGGTGAFDAVADAQIESDPGQLNGYFGYSVASAGDVNGDGFGDIVIGQLGAAPDGQQVDGAAFIYFGGAGDFNSVADADLRPGNLGAAFGVSVAGAGDVNGDGFADVIVGDYQYRPQGTPDGAAFIYLGGAGAFDETADAVLEDAQPSTQMGVSVAGAGDVNGDGFADVIVGANLHDNGQDNEGAAFVYFGGTGAFDLIADAQLEPNQSFASFGFRVAGAGDTNGDGYADIIIGSPLYDDGQDAEGAAFLYFGGAGAFNQTTDAQLESNQVNSRMGWNVAGAGDVNGDGFADVMVGASWYDNGQVDEGAAFIYFGGAGAFDTTADGQFESNQADADFGQRVAGAGDVNGDGFADVLVGAPNYDNGQSGEGAAFLYFGSATDFNTTTDAQLESNQGSALMGGSVAGAGDVNGDGFSDVLVGVSDYDNGQVDEGAAFLYFGSAGAFDTTPDAQLESNQLSAFMGNSVAGAGDVNGDGYADVVVGSWFHDNGQDQEGAALIFFGGAGAFNTTADAHLESNQAGALMGESVAGAGDVNGDGYADVVVGAPEFDNGQNQEGAAFIYFGSAGAFNITADAQLESNQVDAFMAVSVAGAGDVNGDGFGDVIVGAADYDSGTDDEGIAFIYFGGAGAFNTTVDAVLESNQLDAFLGNSVAGAGDVNGDGFSDVIVGAWFYSNGQAQEGAAFIYLGGAGAFNTVADAHLEPNQAGALFGAGVAGAGDVNGDGFGDVIVGSSFYNNGQNDEGGAFVFLGGPGVFNTFADTRLESNQQDAHLGRSLAGVGDVNGDGFADVVVGALDYDNGQTGEGAAFVYFGSAEGRLVMAGQYRDGGSSLVQPWGSSQQADGFVVALNATSPRGRERARLQVEACPNGAPFGSVQCEIFVAGSWTEIGANQQGSTVSLTATGLDVDRLHHWRARAQYAPLTVTAPGVSPPPNPMAGPWRRLQANADVADILTHAPVELIFKNGFE